MATTRLRRTFHYPTDSDDDDAVEEGMDEQDQKTIISTLARRDTASTTLYTHILLALPLVLAILHISRLFGITTVVPTLAAMTSLLASAYILYFLPLSPVNDSREPKTKPQTKSSSKESWWNNIIRGGAVAEQRDVPFLPPDIVDLLREYIEAANSALCAILAFAELYQGRSWSEGAMIGGGYVPMIVWMVVMFARKELRALDLTELERLSYTGGRI